MPQMAPINWTLMMLYFTFIIILFNIMNFYNFMYFLKKLSPKKISKINWKW